MFTFLQSKICFNKIVVISQFLFQTTEEKNYKSNEELENYASQ